MTVIRRHYPCLLILAIYILCILAANPKGEFPLNDDWSYVRTAFAFGSGQGLKVDEWSAPSLIGQAIYGGLLVKLIAPSFLVLRLSTILLSCFIALLFWSILRRISIRKDLACVMILAWLFNPLQFNLSFGFMTEVPFLFFVVLATYLYVLYRDTRRTWQLILSAAVLGYAFLIRQTSVFFILALLGAVVTDAPVTFRKRIQQCLGVASAFGIFIISYYLWIALRGGSTAAVQKKFEYLQKISSEQIIGNSYGMLFYLVFMSAPIWLFLARPICRLVRDVRGIVRLEILTVLLIAIATGVLWFWANNPHMQYLPSASYHARMPYLLNVLYDSGLGPITLDPAYFGPSPNPIYPRVWTFVTALVAIGVLLCGLLFIIGLIRRQRLRLLQEQRPLFIFAGLALLFLIPFEIIFSHLREGGLFDRHVLIVSFPFYLLLGLFSAGEEKSEESRFGFSALLPAGIAIAVLGMFCVAAMHDYMEWNRVRWEMGRGLLQRGIDPLSIVGGFEFNAWHNYDTYVARGNIANVHQWWYDRRDYIISTSLQQGYDVLEKKEYFSWVHRCPISLFLIQDSSCIIKRAPDRAQTIQKAAHPSGSSESSYQGERKAF
jgi:hypothetical protein